MLGRCLTATELYGESIGIMTFPGTCSHSSGSSRHRVAEAGLERKMIEPAFPPLCEASFLISGDTETPRGVKRDVLVPAN